MGQHYEHPPIIEAIAEFHFAPHTPWDGVMPGLIYDQVKAVFPKRRDAQAVFLNVRRTTREAQLRPIERIQFLQADEHILMQIGPQFLSINHRAPYSSWDAWLPIIRQAFTAYTDVIETPFIERLSLRYLNRLLIPELSFDPKEYVTFYPSLGAGMPQEFSQFIVGIQVPYQDVDDSLKIELSSAASPDATKSALHLDLQYSFFQEGDMAFDHDISSWLSVAHQRIEDSFEACVTEKMRSLFLEG